MAKQLGLLQQLLCIDFLSILDGMLVLKFWFCYADKLTWLNTVFEITPHPQSFKHCQLVIVKNHPCYHPIRTLHSQVFMQKFNLSGSFVVAYMFKCLETSGMLYVWYQYCSFKGMRDKQSNIATKLSMNNMPFDYTTIRILQVWAALHVQLMLFILYMYPTEITMFKLQRRNEINSGSCSQK